MFFICQLMYVASIILAASVTLNKYIICSIVALL